MKTSLFPLLVLSSGLACLPAAAQMTVPEPTPANVDQPIRLDAAAPLDSLENQLESAAFDQRGAFATAFDDANRAIDERAAALRADGLLPADEAESNLASARDEARQAFRDLSLTTSETWASARHNAVIALRKIRGALEVLQRTATQPRA
jgi:hypothetical protein